MSTKALRWLLSDYVSVCAARNGEFGTREPDESERAAYQAALAEVEAIEKAAKDMTRLGGGDFTYNIRDTEDVMAWAHKTGRSSWEAPDVKAWSDASMLLATIAKDAP